MRDEQFAEILALGHESQGVEFKGAGPRTSKLLRGKVVRAVLGMANRRDGGVVIIGVDEDKAAKTLVHTGLTESEAATWDYDELADTLSNYADPAVTFNVTTQMYDGKRFVVITVSEFDDIPILCKKDYPHPTDPKVLLTRSGACYVRSRHKPETSEIPTHADMRALLDLASQKRLRWFLSQASGAGLQLPGPRHPDDAEHFQAQYADVSDPVLERIRSRGYTQVVIRPERFVPDRLPSTRLLPLLQQATVTRFGWNFPQQGRGSELQHYQDRISKPNDWNNYIEWWAFYTSAQFVDFRAFEVDWFELANHLGPWKEQYSAIASGTVLSVYDVVRQFTSTFEFTARLALDPIFPGDEPIHVTLALHGLRGRELTLLGASGRSPLYRHVTQTDDYSSTRVVSREEVSANSAGIALEEATQLFAAFGWEPAAGLLADIQAELTRG